MLLPNGEVIEESLEIMQYLLNWELNEDETYWIDRNDNEFKYHLDRYKYPNRFENVDFIQQRDLAKRYLDDLDSYLSDSLPTRLSDALFPFVRQFANHDRAWFDAQDWQNLHQWLENNLISDEFARCMKKYQQWHAGDEVAIFPTTE